MARINLLPWRAERRKQRQREFQGMLGLAALGGALLSFLIWLHYDRQIEGQHERNAFLEAEIAKVKKQNEEIKELDAKKDRLLARKKVIEELQANRSQMVHLFDALVRTIPDGVVLTSLKQEGDILTLQGSAQSNARVSAYMRNLEGSGWMTRPDLSIIEAKDEKAEQAAPVGRTLPYNFTLKVTLANPQQQQQGEGLADAVADAAAAEAADAPAEAAPAQEAGGASPEQPAPQQVPAAPAPAEAPEAQSQTQGSAAP
ncbi:PilN domain-containing protein [Pseudoxanthomonas taiwanensis]|uniref:Fimbrial protein n=1 Tax=Pseudoxanthomonas taiwanensis TaxID=176598 RepID=A0A921NVT8_9GAMM|nr:PilN domain-containing protein [Pseudoxanthomonas taiwanensis]KAF1689017.1 fimbrial protein [Pseudoxanthomonas taiwanensis]